MGLSIERVAILLLIAAVVAIVARRLHVPYSVGLVFAGLALALLPFPPNVEITKQLIFSAFLPPLIFEAAFQLPWRELRRDLAVILLLATVGVVLSGGATAIGMHYVVRWAWISALVFGVLIAATDPVSVIATFREAKVTGRLRLLVEAESLFNDGTAAVAFVVVLAFASGEGIGALGVTKTLVVIIVGSIASGAIIAALALLLAGATNDHLVEITFTVIAAYGSFLLAEHFHLSGVLATLTSGLIIGNVGHLAISHSNREEVEGFWEYTAFVANSLIFLLIGLRLAHQNFRSVLLPATIAIVLVILSRALVVYLLSLVFMRSSLRIKSQHQHVLFWGGLRGALALALALGLPEEIPGRQAIIGVAFAVVAFSIVVQGMTIKTLLRRLRVIE